MNDIKLDILKVNNEIFNCRGDDIDLTPSDIIPGVELIKYEKRSLGGKLHVDVVDSKQTLQVVFDRLNQEEYEEVKRIFSADNPNPYGIKVEYNGITRAGRKYFVTDITFSPLITGEIIWRDVTVSLVEV